MDAGPPGGGGKGLHNSGAAQNGYPAQHSQAGIGGLQGDLLAAGDRDLGHEAGFGVQASVLGRRANGLGHHPARNACHRRLSHLYSRSRAGDGADPWAAGDFQAGLVGRAVHGDADFGAVGGVGVVATVLNDGAEHPLVINPLAAVDVESGVLSHGQVDGHIPGGLSGEQGCDGSLGRGGGAGAGRVTGPHPLPVPHRRPTVIAFPGLVVVLRLRHCGQFAIDWMGYGLQTSRTRSAATATTRSSTPSGGATCISTLGYFSRAACIPPSTFRLRIIPGKNR